MAQAKKKKTRKSIPSTVKELQAELEALYRKRAELRVPMRKHKRGTKERAEARRVYSRTQSRLIRVRKALAEKQGKDLPERGKRHEDGFMPSDLRPVKKEKPAAKPKKKAATKKKAASKKKTASKGGSKK